MCWLWHLKENKCCCLCKLPHLWISIAICFQSTSSTGVILLPCDITWLQHKGESRGGKGNYSRWLYEPLFYLLIYFSLCFLVYYERTCGICRLKIMLVFYSTYTADISRWWIKTARFANFSSDHSDKNGLFFLNCSSFWYLNNNKGLRTRNIRLIREGALPTGVTRLSMVSSAAFWSFVFLFHTKRHDHMFQRHKKRSKVMKIEHLHQPPVVIITGNVAGLVLQRALKLDWFKILLLKVITKGETFFKVM